MSNTCSVCFVFLVFAAHVSWVCLEFDNRDAWVVRYFLYFIEVF